MISNHKRWINCRIFTIFVLLLCPSPSPFKKQQQIGGGGHHPVPLFLVEATLAGILEFEQPMTALRRSRKVIVTFADRMATTTDSLNDPERLPMGWEQELRQRWANQRDQGQITHRQLMAKELQLDRGYFMIGEEDSKIQTARGRGNRPIDILFVGDGSVKYRYAERIRQGLTRGEKHTKRSAAQLLDRAYRQTADARQTELVPSEYLMTDYRNIHNIRVGLPEYKRINDIGRRGLADRERRRRRRKNNRNSYGEAMSGKQRRTPTSAERTQNVLRKKNERQQRIRKRPVLPAPSGFRIDQPGDHLIMGGYNVEQADPHLTNEFGQEEMAVRESGQTVIADLAQAFGYHSRLETSARQPANGVSASFDGRAINELGQYERFGHNDAQEASRWPKHPTFNTALRSRTSDFIINHLVEQGELVPVPNSNRLTFPENQPVPAGADAPMAMPPNPAEQNDPMDLGMGNLKIGGRRSRQGNSKSQGQQRRRSPPSGSKPSTSASSSSATASSSSTARNPQPPPVPTSSSSSSSRRRSRSRGKYRSGSRDRRKGSSGIGKTGRQNG